jgi:hypothetical protein
MDTDPSTIFGYIIHEPGDPHVVHYLYVKAPFRQKGLGRLLLDIAKIPKIGDSTVKITHWTSDIEPMVRKNKDLVFYDPYDVYDIHPNEEEQYAAKR